jgi:hypothetical protein
MKFKKFLLLWNDWANLNQTLLKWSLAGPLSKLCLSAPSCIQDGQGSFQQSLVEIGTVVSEERIFFKFYPPFFLICIIGQNRQKFKFHKKSRPFQNYPRRPPLLKVEISSNGQNCSILNQKVPKFELYKHNDELFNMYYGIFYELWTFAYLDHPRIISAKFGWDWLSIFRAEDFF